MDLLYDDTDVEVRDAPAGVRERLGDLAIRVSKRPLWSLLNRVWGIRLQSPVHYYDLTRVAAEFETDAERARRFVPPGPFDLRTDGPGRTHVTVALLDVHEADVLGPYREVAVSLPVRYTGVPNDPVDGELYLLMPCTTDEARWGGVANYGFPTVRADVQVQHRPGVRAVSVVLDDQLLLTMDVEEAPTVQDTTTIRNLSVRDDGRVIESGFEYRGTVGRTERRGGARLALGSHPFADDLRAMGIDTESRAHEFVPSASGVLTAGYDVGAAPPVRPGISAGLAEADRREDAPETPRPGA